MPRYASLSESGCHFYQTGFMTPSADNIINNAAEVIMKKKKKTFIDHKKINTLTNNYMNTKNDYK